jgi:hypothetical protein
MTDFKRWRGIGRDSLFGIGYTYEVGIQFAAFSFVITAINSSCYMYADIG